MIEIVYLVFISMVISAIFNLKLSIKITLFFIFLVPVLQLPFGNIFIGVNIYFLLVFTIFIVNAINRKIIIEMYIIIPYIFFTILMLFTVIINDGLPKYLQLYYLRIDVMSSFLLPLVLWYYTDNSSIVYIKKIMIIIIIVMSIYSLYNSITGLNDYVDYILNYFGRVNNYEIYQKSIRSGFFGRAQSTMSHPMAWSAVINMFVYFCLIFYNKNQKSKYFFLFFIILLILDSFLSGVRTGLIALLVGLSYLMFRKYKSKIIFVAFILIFISNFNIDTSFLGKYQQYGDSIIDILQLAPKSTIGGSSLDVREKQLDAAIGMVANQDILFGKGYGWSVDYYTNIGDHPLLVGFESLVFVALIDTGVFGLIIWSVFLLSLFYLHRMMLKNKQNSPKYIYILDAFLISYITLVIGTGLIRTLLYFNVMYILILQFAIYFTSKNELNYKS